MSDTNGKTPAQLFHDDDIVQRALDKATREALRRHKALGVAIAVERNGRVVWIEPEDIVVPEA